MTTDAAQRAAQASAELNLKVRAPYIQPDYATILGLVVSTALILGAIAVGQSDANFVNGPAFMIVIFGTMAATSIAYSGKELRHVPRIIGKTIFKRVRSPSAMATQLMIIAALARKRGILALSSVDNELKKDPFLYRSVQMVTDGFSAKDIEGVLGQEVDAIVDRHKRAASIVKRASEIAPAMGLIGTLVGLVQMLAQLDDPATVGPAMAVALLTTFYGAILGTVVLGPLSAKLERNSNDEAMIKGLVLSAMISIADQDNPRRLQMLLNSALPPDQQISYFD